MTQPAPIGVLHWDTPRAVKIRTPNDIEPWQPETLHSAVHSPIFVWVDSLIDANKIVTRWSEIMQAAADKAAEILAGE